MEVVQEVQEKASEPAPIATAVEIQEKEAPEPAPIAPAVETQEPIASAPVDNIGGELSSLLYFTLLYCTRLYYY